MIMIHEQFDSVFSNPKPDISPDLDPNEERLPDIDHISFTKSGVLKLLKINPNTMTVYINIHK